MQCYCSTYFIYYFCCCLSSNECKRSKIHIWQYFSTEFRSDRCFQVWWGTCTLNYILFLCLLWRCLFRHVKCKFYYAPLEEAGVYCSACIVCPFVRKPDLVWSITLVSFGPQPSDFIGLLLYEVEDPYCFLGH